MKHRICHVFVCILAGICVSVSASLLPSAAQRYFEPEKYNGAYEATIDSQHGKTVEFLYDHGKYAIRTLEWVRLYDGSNQAVRWHIDPKRRTAKVDFSAVEQELFRQLVAQGVDRVSHSTGLSKNELVRFQKTFPQSAVRNLDHLLYSPSKEEHVAYRQLGVETVCGFKCAIYVSKQSPENRMWVDPSTGFVFRKHDKSVSENPRILPQTYDWRLKSFRKAVKIDPSKFKLPPGTTAILPRILANMPLPSGVKRKILTGKDSELGYSLR